MEKRLGLEGVDADTLKKRGRTEIRPYSHELRNEVVEELMLS